LRAQVVEQPGNRRAVGEVDRGGCAEAVFQNSEAEDLYLDHD
jgi:hypothetical protein